MDYIKKRKTWFSNTAIMDTKTRIQTRNTSFMKKISVDLQRESSMST